MKSQNDKLIHIQQQKLNKAHKEICAIMLKQTHIL